MSETATIFVRKVIFTDGSFFWRGECNACDWSDEALEDTMAASLAEVHLRVFHQGGRINIANNRLMKIEG